MNIIINYDTNEILYKSSKTTERIKKDLENYYKNDINKLENILINTKIDEIDIYNCFDIEIEKNTYGMDCDELRIYGDDGIVTLWIMNINKLDIF